MINPSVTLSADYDTKQVRGSKLVSISPFLLSLSSTVHKSSEDKIFHPLGASSFGPRSLIKYYLGWGCLVMELKGPFIRQAFCIMNDFLSPSA